MNFPYQKITSKITRPIIPIILKSNDKFIFYQALVDSGADYCIFSSEVAGVLGVRLSRKKVNMRGIGLEKVNGRWGKIEIKIGDITHKTKVIFAKINEFGHGILGQQGFFNYFDIKLSYRRKVIEIDPYKF